MKPTIRNYARFFDYCIYGNLEEAQKMISDNLLLLTDIDEDIFSYTCYFGQITVAKWIYSLNPEKYRTVAIKSELLKTVELVGHSKVAEWMMSI